MDIPLSDLGRHEYNCSCEKKQLRKNILSFRDQVKPNCRFNNMTKFCFDASTYNKVYKQMHRILEVLITKTGVIHTLLFLSETILYPFIKKTILYYDYE